MNELEQIEQTLLEIYKKNIDFLEKNHKTLHTKIIDFESLGYESYFIDFVDNHFELLDKDGSRIYNCDPFYDAQYRSNNIYKNSFGISLIDQEKRTITSDDNFDFNLFINQYIELFKNKKIDNLTKFKKMVFIGTLLGVHLNDIDRVIDCDSYLIVEDNIEIFRLSLFLTDYTQLSLKTKLFFAIDEKKDNLIKIVKEFLNYNYQYNYFIKYEITSENYLDCLDNISNIIASHNPSIYPYSELLRSFINGIYNFNYVQNGILKLKQNRDILGMKKLFYLGAGPSLVKNIDFIKQNRDSFIIVAVASALKRLSKEDIVADIIISIDSNKSVDDSFFIDEKYYKNSIVIASINTHKDVIKIFNIDKLFLVQNSMELFRDAGVFTGVTVGDIGVKILLKLGVKELYLCGIDAALDQTSGETHDNTHISSTSKELKAINILDSDDNDFSNKVTKVKGNFQDEVFTTVYYNTIIESFKTIDISQNQKIYNISNGAYLPHTIPINSKDIDLLSNSSTISLDDIILKLKDISKTDLSNSEKVELKNNHIKEKIIEYYSKLLDPYYFYILENGIATKDQIDNIRANQISIIQSELKDPLDIIIS